MVTVQRWPKYNARISNIYTFKDRILKDQVKGILFSTSLEAVCDQEKDCLFSPRAVLKERTQSGSQPKETQMLKDTESTDTFAN